MEELGPNIVTILINLNEFNSVRKGLSDWNTQIKTQFFTVYMKYSDPDG